MSMLFDFFALTVDRFVHDAGGSAVIGLHWCAIGWLGVAEFERENEESLFVWSKETVEWMKKKGN